MNVYIKSGDITDMQGPCPSGFHIPTKDEFDGLISIMSGLSITKGIHYSIYLHMPFVGNRSNVTAEVLNRGTYCWYFTSSSLSQYSSPTRFSMYGSGTPETNYTFTTEALPIRGFKDSYVIPDNTWTVITGTLGSGGIFWNESDGIISITGDGSTGYTIADKNVGATTVYSYGDTLTDANMGYMYQWGNNYGFPSTGTISKKSSTQVDASNYGPGNYYSSDTFITNNNVPCLWDSSKNTNLRGGVTGPVSMSEVKNIYIGEYKGFVPGSNTIAYFPFKEDTADHSGNGNVLTLGTATKASIGYGITQRAAFLNSNVKTVLGWAKISSTTYPYDMFIMGNDNAGAAYYFYHVQSNFNQKFVCFYNSSYRGATESYTMDLNKWYLIGTTIDTENNKVCGYANGQKIFEYNGTGYNFSSEINFFHEQRDGGGNYGSNVCYLSECIAESKARTAQEFQDYYNQTKSNYGL